MKNELFSKLCQIKITSIGLMITLFYYYHTQCVNTGYNTKRLEVIPASCSVNICFNKLG
jgi:hypothetical protein